MNKQLEIQQTDISISSKPIRVTTIRSMAADSHESQRTTIKSENITLNLFVCDGSCQFSTSL